MQSKPIHSLRGLTLLSVFVVIPALGSCSVLGGGEQQRVFELRLNTAVSKYNEGNVVMAANMARNALEVQPGNGEALSILGMSLARNAASQKDPRRAYGLLTESIDAFMQAEEHGASKRFQVQFGHGTARAQRARVCFALVDSLQKRLDATIADEAKPGAEKLTAVKEKIQAEMAKLRDTAKTDMEIGIDRLLLASERDPNYAETLEHLQAVYALSENYEKSIEWGKKALDANDAIRERRQRELAQPRLDVTSGQAVRAEITKLDIKEANLRSMLALAYSRTNNPGGAVLELNRVLAIDPDRFEEYFNRGLSRQSMGEFAAAIGDFESFIRKSGAPSTDPMVREAWERIYDCRKKGNLAEK
jgi:tetratricopeptide (TPR) repeat protein